VSERTGLGVVEIAILEALETRGFRKCANALNTVEQRIGLAPGYAYEVLVDLARPWTLPVGLVDGHGNFGSRDFGDPANSRYTEARISPAGRVALAAERGELAPVPIGLINGSTHREGLRPPFRPRAVLDAIRAVLTRPKMPDSELTAIVGQPSFLTGCQVTGDLEALAAGRRTELGLQARLSISDDHSQVIIENIPPNIMIADVCEIITTQARDRRWGENHPGLHRLTRLPLADLRDETSERTSPFGRIICIPEHGTTAGELRDMLLKVFGVNTTMPVALPRPLPALIRRWVRASAREDLPASLTRLEQALPGQE
jgi:DNA gyrase/topoisomerase IV, subunit A